MPKIIDKTNFHINTFGVFTRCKTPNIEADFTSFSGSKYWFIGDDLIRQSNHWTHKVRSCAWVLCLGQDFQGCPETAKIRFVDLKEKNSREYLKSTCRRKKYKRIAKERAILKDLTLGHLSV